MSISRSAQEDYNTGVPNRHGVRLLQVEYTSTQLDLLALLFTVVKLLYMGGALPRCARVVHLLTAASAASSQELHKTLIRNEAAYFGCVKQLVLQHPPPPQPQPAATLPLYLCGDSHCLSGVCAHQPSAPSEPFYFQKAFTKTVTVSVACVRVLV